MSSSKIDIAKAQKLCTQAAELRQNQEFESALGVLAQALELDPKNIDAWYEQFLVYWDVGDYETAEKIISEAIVVTDWKSFYANVGETRQLQGKSEEAIEAYQTLLQHEPQNHWGMSGLASVYLSQKNYPVAAEWAEKALQIDSMRAEGHGVLGSVAEARGDMVAAQRYFEKAVEFDPIRWQYALENIKRSMSQDNAWPFLPTVSEMVSYLDRFVCSQTRAKETLAAAVYNHYLSLAWQEHHTLNSDLGRFNALIFGPSGCGKTYMIDLLTKKLGVPIVIVSATSLVQTGYMGKRVDSILEDLIAAADYDVNRAERGIVFIDEIDKVRRQGGDGPDVSGEGVQNGLLTMLEGRPYRIHIDQRGDFTINTSKVLFIAAGAFDGIDESVKKRLGTNSRLGFGGTASNKDMSLTEILSHVSVEDLEQYGIIPQLAGRFSSVAPLTTLTREDLYKILTSMEDSALKKQKKLYEIHGIELDISKEAIEAIVNLTESKKVGARGLRAAVSTMLRSLTSKLDTLQKENVRKITLDESFVVKNTEPVLEYKAEAEEAGQLLSLELRKKAFVKLRNAA